MEAAKITGALLALISGLLGIGMLVAGSVLVEILGAVMLVVFVLSLILATIGSAAQRIEQAIKAMSAGAESAPGPQRAPPEGFRFQR
jgi:hypothetical protein